ncbi:MAG: DUF72 domain-containing protein [Aestuariivirga sp.]
MIKVGIGGWTYEPWRGLFYPEKLSQAKELYHASRHVTSIEVNGTFYSTFKPATFRKWWDETPDDFIFSLKAPRFAVNRRVLSEAGASITKFLESGVSELKTKLGPILWQFAHTKKYDPADIQSFLKLLPKTVDGLKLCHVLEVRHETFLCAEFVAQAKSANVAVVLADSEKYPLLPDVTSDFVYLRLQNSVAKVKTGYKTAQLEHWAKLAKAMERGEEPQELGRIGDNAAPKKPRDVFLYFIAGAKERNPAAAQAMIKILQG